MPPTAPASPARPDDALDYPPKLPIVAIGASAGGLAALEELVRRLTLDGMAYVVVQHLAPTHDSALAEILARATPLKVATIRDGMRIEANVVFVVPPDADVTIEGGVLHLHPPSERATRRTIDVFFRSLALERGPAAIGVVLSGAGTDGTLGLRAIKEEGGITFAQEPTSAGHASMPESALDSGFADFCLSPSEIGDELMRLGRHPFVAPKRPRRLFGDEALSKVFENLRRAFGVDFSAYKVSTIERRVARRMALAKLERVEDYLKFIETPGELSRLYGDLLIGVTGFFRDKEPFEKLKTVVFPRLLEHRGGEHPIRIWAPGCSTGEEAYSIAICLLEYLGERAHEFKIQIFATDIDDEALTRARLGIYPPTVEIDVSAERLQRFFTHLDKGYQVTRRIRDMVVFAHHHVGKDPPFSRIDLVSCRNVLIYMQPPLQRKMLRIFHYALNPDAFLLLGLSESIGEASDLFSLADRDLKLYTKKNVASAAVHDFTFGGRGGREEGGPGAAASQPPEHRFSLSVQQIADRKAIERYAPAGVLLNDKLEIMQFRGRTGAYLEPVPGAANWSVFKLARPELLVELRAAIHKASTDDTAVESAPIRFWNGTDATITIDVVPVPDPAAKRRFLLVSFHEREAASALEPGAPAHERRPERDHARLEDVQRELLTTKEYLQTTVQELESSNEELQSSNEELQSSNEELQSTNEELETSKEELQSTNEELATVNEELRSRMAQLAVTNDDLHNVLATVATPVVIVGVDLRIRCFSTAAEKLLSLIAGDVGRPIGYLGNTIKAPQIEQLVGDTIRAVVVKEQRVHCTDGRWYTLRVSPYRTADYAIRGALLEFLAAPSARKIGEMAEVNEFVGKVLSTLPHALVLLDDQMRAIWANVRFFDRFQVGAEILGTALDEVWAGRADYPELFSMLETTVAGGQPFKDFRGPPSSRRPNGLPSRFSAQRVPSEGDRPAMTLLIIEDSPEAAGGL